MKERENLNNNNKIKSHKGGVGTAHDMKVASREETSFFFFLVCVCVVKDRIPNRIPPKKHNQYLLFCVYKDAQMRSQH